jgi:DNA-binding XRE family transcriptional regulator
VNTVNCHHCGSRLVSVLTVDDGSTEHTCTLCGRQWWVDEGGVLLGSRRPDIAPRRKQQMARTQGAEDAVPVRPLPTTGPAAQLRLLRTRRDLTITDLARRSGVGHKTISNYELGQRTGYRGTWLLLCDALGVTPEEMGL